jgi:hypothetical protein
MTRTTVKAHSAQPSQISGQGAPTDPESYRLGSILKQSNTTYHSQTTLLGISRLISMTLASLLPIAAIVVLYAVREMAKRLGIIAALTTAFSLALGLVTDGELIDVFAASAA